MRKKLSRKFESQNIAKKEQMSVKLYGSSTSKETFVKNFCIIYIVMKVLQA